MTKRAARLFFFISTLLSALVFTILTIDSHRQFPTLTNAAAIDARVIAGKHVWHREKTATRCSARAPTTPLTSRRSPRSAARPTCSSS
jgi:nitric oxide reductase subunit C